MSLSTSATNISSSVVFKPVGYSYNIESPKIPEFADPKVGKDFGCDEYEVDPLDTFVILASKSTSRFDKIIIQCANSKKRKYKYVHIILYSKYQIIVNYYKDYDQFIDTRQVFVNWNLAPSGHNVNAILSLICQGDASIEDVDMRYKILNPRFLALPVAKGFDILPDLADYKVQNELGLLHVEYPLLASEYIYIVDDHERTNYETTYFLCKTEDRDYDYRMTTVLTDYLAITTFYKQSNRTQPIRFTLHLGFNNTDTVAYTSLTHGNMYLLNLHYLEIV